MILTLFSYQEVEYSEEPGHFVASVYKCCSITDDSDIFFLIRKYNTLKNQAICILSSTVLLVEPGTLNYTIDIIL
jgi:hypothetical protein